MTAAMGNKSGYSTMDSMPMGQQEVYIHLQKEWLHFSSDFKLL